MLRTSREDNDAPQIMYLVSRHCLFNYTLRLRSCKCCSNVATPRGIFHTCRHTEQRRQAPSARHEQRCEFDTPATAAPSRTGSTYRRAPRSRRSHCRVARAMCLHGAFCDRLSSHSNASCRNARKLWRSAANRAAINARAKYTLLGRSAQLHAA